ncbi:MAG: thiamine-phosphate kinase, partial [Desulforhabdus sp.]|nr:thiamine-phosphate kinase [Desulforhabdus sp.]
MKIRDLGEFGLINRIARLLPAPPSDVVVGIGDDVAVLQARQDKYLLATCDIQIENVHFLADRITPYQLGRRIVAINVSDIAAMGGSPDWALVSLALPKHQQITFVDDLYRGMQEQMEAAAANIVGGNISGAKDIVIDFFLLGNVAPQHLIRRNGARQGDLIMVTGTLGDSRAGVELIRGRRADVSENAHKVAIQRHLTPRPRLLQGQMLGHCGKVHAMADVSDGLLGDLRHICEASRVGAELRAQDIPVGDACLEVAAALGTDGLEWALSG